MANLKRSQDHIVTLRRKAVSQARLRGMSLEEISQWMEGEGLVNPDTKRPYSISTISNDLRFLENKWEEDMMVSTGSHRARVMAELGQVKSAAWKAGKLDTVLRAITKEVDLLGLNELDRMGVEIAIANLFKGMPPELASQLKKKISTKLLERKKQEKGKVIRMKRVN